MARAISEQYIERAIRAREVRGIPDRGVRYWLGHRLISWGERISAHEPRIA
ncbi:MAG TPA: hypothetical protein VFP42_01415 [Acidimicrobiia bacterium]|nr:hypothetical protein [Acidimicrobiia bacterium]